MVKKLRGLLTGEILRYAFIGGCTTLVNLASFWVLCRWTALGQSDGGITAANVLSIILAILFAYITNKLFVFRSHTAGLTALLGEFAAFVAGRLATMAIEVGGVWLMVSVLRQNPMLGKLLTQGFVIVGNYFISKFLVFRGGRRT